MTAPEQFDTVEQISSGRQFVVTEVRYDLQYWNGYALAVTALDNGNEAILMSNEVRVVTKYRGPGRVAVLDINRPQHSFAY